MISDKNYNKISDEVYKVDPIKVPDINKQVKEDHSFTSGNDEFVVIKAEGNSLNPTDNGMQAMAVAPVVKGGKL